MTWNKCDFCGKFISYEDLDSGKAVRCLDTPDSDYSQETYKTEHVACRLKHERAGAT